MDVERSARGDGYEFENHLYENGYLILTGVDAKTIITDGVKVGAQRCLIGPLLSTQLSAPHPPPHPVLQNNAADA